MGAAAEGLTKDYVSAEWSSDRIAQIKKEILTKK
jgi:hypothetical protein